MPLPVLCSICQVTLIDEVQSECGHFFCRKCLENCFNMVGGDTLKCPECRTPILRSILQGKGTSNQRKVSVIAEDESEAVYGRQTDLHEASFKGDLDKVKKLVGNGADIYERSDEENKGFAPIHDASHMGNVDVVTYFMSKDRSLAKLRSVEQGLMPIHAAALNGKKSVVSYFIEDCGINTEVRNIKHGRTPLHLASNKGHVNVARYLVGRGADVRAKSSTADDEDMPIHTAAYFGSLHIVKYFIEDVDSTLEYAKNKKGYIPFHNACVNGKLDIAKYFITDRNVNIEYRCQQYSMTPLHKACNSGSVDVVKLLLEHGADIKAVDKDKWTMLHVAAFFGRLEVAKYIVSRSPGLITALDKEDETALDLAKKSTRAQHAEVAKFLE